MDGDHTLAAARYVELNPVRAGLVAAAEDWPWSSTQAHLSGRDDGLVQAQPLLGQAPDWRAFLDAGLGDDEREALRAGERTGRPLGSAGFVAGLEQTLGRPLARGKPGPKPAIAGS
jgi:putative transposase